MANGNVARYPNTRLYRTFDRFQDDLTGLGRQLAQLSGSVPGITGAIEKFHTSSDNRLEAMTTEFARLLADIAVAIDTFRVAADRRLDTVTVEFARLLPSIADAIDNLRVAGDRRFEAVIVEFARFFPAIDQGNA